MTVEEYDYTVEECDVPKVRWGSLREYRAFRRKCLEYLRGPSDTSVARQVHDLAWHTAVFRTLNEARRIESDRAVNAALWDLTTAGYTSLMTLGIRKLVDRNPKTDSVWNVIATVERRPEMLTREKFICYDGLPYDYEAVHHRYIASLGSSVSGRPRWLPTTGPEAWGMSQMMHEAFDKLAGNPAKRKRGDTIHPSILATLKERLSHPAIEKVRTMANRRIAHAERISRSSEPVPITTYNDVDAALEQIVRITNFLSSYFFYDAAFGAIVPTPQFTVLEGLDQPWVTSENIQRLHEYWNEISAVMDQWADVSVDEFLPRRPSEDRQS